jgi:hypothetical protein
MTSVQQNAVTTTGLMTYPPPIALPIGWQESYLIDISGKKIFFWSVWKLNDLKRKKNNQIPLGMADLCTV